MITVQLDQSNEQQLQELARRQGRDAAQVAAHIIEAYLDARGWAQDTDEQWAESSTALARDLCRGGLVRRRIGRWIGVKFDERICRSQSVADLS